MYYIRYRKNFKFSYLAGSSLTIEILAAIPVKADAANTGVT